MFSLYTEYTGLLAQTSSESNLVARVYIPVVSHTRTYTHTPIYTNPTGEREPEVLDEGSRCEVMYKGGDVPYPAVVATVRV